MFFWLEMPWKTMMRPVNQRIRNATEAIMARPGFCRGFFDSSPTTATASQPA